MDLVLTKREKTLTTRNCVWREGDIDTEQRYTRWIRRSKAFMLNELWHWSNRMPSRNLEKSKRFSFNMASLFFTFVEQQFLHPTCFVDSPLETTCDTHRRTMFGLLQWTLRQEVLPESGHLHDQCTDTGHGLSQGECHSTVERSDWTHEFNCGQGDSSEQVWRSKWMWRRRRDRRFSLQYSSDVRHQWAEECRTR